MMKQCYVTILLLAQLSILGCAAPQKYYQNNRYTGDIQGYLNRDLAYCHAIAQGMKPTVTPYIPPSPTTTYGSGVIADNHGNIYSGTYQQTTYPNENMALYGSANNLARSIQASNIYNSIKEQCLSGLGWYEISKDKYLELQNVKTLDKQKQDNAQKLNKQKQVDEHNKQFFSIIKNEHPDFVALSIEKRNAIILSIETWIKAKPFTEAEPLLIVFKKGNANEVANLFTQYKKHLGISKFKQ